MSTTSSSLSNVPHSINYHTTPPHTTPPHKPSSHVPTQLTTSPLKISSADSSSLTNIASPTFVTIDIASRQSLNNSTGLASPNKDSRLLIPSSPVQNSNATPPSPNRGNYRGNLSSNDVKVNTTAEEIRKLMASDNNPPWTRQDLTLSNLPDLAITHIHKIRSNGEYFTDEITDMHESYQSERTRKIAAVAAFIFLGIGLSMYFSQDDTTLKIGSIVFMAVSFPLLCTALVSKAVSIKVGSRVKEESVMKLSKEILDFNNFNSPTFPQLITTTALKPSEIPTIANVDKPESHTVKTFVKELEPESGMPKTLSNHLDQFSKGIWPKPKWYLRLTCFSQRAGMGVALNTLHNHKFYFSRLITPEIFKKFKTLLENTENRTLLAWEAPLHMLELGRRYNLIRAEFRSKGHPALSKAKKKLEKFAYDYSTGEDYSKISYDSSSSLTSPRCLSFNKRLTLIREILEDLSKYFIVQGNSNDLKIFEDACRDAKHDSSTPITLNIQAMRIIRENKTKYEKQFKALDNYAVTPLTLTTFASKVDKIVKQRMEDDSKKTRQSLMNIYELAEKIEITSLRDIPEDNAGTRASIEQGIDTLLGTDKATFLRFLKTEHKILGLVKEYMAFSFNDFILDPRNQGVGFRKLIPQQQLIEEQVDAILNDEEIA